MKPTLLAIALFSLPLAAEESGFTLPATNVRGADYPRILPDLRVHFRIKAPDARTVQFDLGIREIGATAIRLAHYPQSEYFPTLCDRAGLLVWNEVPFVNEVFDAKESPDSPSAQTQKFNDTLCEEMHEMILQRYNHPAVAFWGLFNELRPGQTNAVALPQVKRLNALTRELDPARITVTASDKTGNPANLVPNRMAYNTYPGWCSAFGDGPEGDMGRLVDKRFSEQKNRRVAISEYGAAGNPAQHQEGIPTKPQYGGPYHPKEWQSHVDESPSAP